MTRGRGCSQKTFENASGQKRKATKQSSRRKYHPLSNLTCEKNQMELGVLYPHVLMESPDKGLKTSSIGPSNVAVWSTDPLVRPSPLPHLGWGSSHDVWMKMISKELDYRHSSSFMQRHPSIQPRMRSVLLDWLMEVSEAYALHRQTFYLAQDYFDRFMLTQSNIGKDLLQLVGITCLFIASKMEEACPPKLWQMAYVTAGTCYEDEILKMELIILQALRWNLCPETSVSWLNLYFQMLSMSSSSNLLEPQFPEDEYLLMTRLLDLCILHINSLDFQYRVLAASVLSYFLHQERVEKVSGLSEDDIQPCVAWMAPFVESVGRSGRAPPRGFTAIKKEDRHNIQTHTDYMTMLEDASQNPGSSHILVAPSDLQEEG